MDAEIEENHLINYDDECAIFDGFGVLVQFLLGLVCFLALVLKRYTDPRRRTWIVWFMVTTRTMWTLY